MAYYRRLEYKKGGVETEEERFELGRMQAIGGIFRTILLKRLESSVYAFRESLKDHISFLETMKGYMEKGKLLSKKSYRRYVLRVDDEIDTESTSRNAGKMELEDFDKSRYNLDRLLADVEKDISLLNGMLEKVKPHKSRGGREIKGTERQTS